MMDTITPFWEPPPENLILKDPDIHVWLTNLATAMPGPLEAYRELLSVDERQRADRFHFERHRRRFILCRGLLRTLLGRYLTTPPDRIEFTYGEHGKPGLNHPAYATALCFNLAHSQDLALFAFSWNRRVGIDVEYQREMPRAESLARRFFSPEEHAGLMSLSPGRRQEGFFRCWTEKEAYLKATGSGFSFPMDQFSVSLSPDEPARLIRVAGDPEAPQSWSMTAFSPETGYQAALVAAGRGGSLFWWQVGDSSR